MSSFLFLFYPTLYEPNHLRGRLLEKNRLELGAIIPYTAYTQNNDVVDFPGVIAL
jgi:hypothetical protein